MVTHDYNGNAVCESCWKAFNDHLGLVGTCGELSKVKEERDTAIVVANDAIREIERILDTGDTYCAREMVANCKAALQYGLPFQIIRSK
jgi:hypothetical protein